MQVLVSVWKHRRHTHSSPCCRKVRKVSLLQVLETWKFRNTYSLQLCLMLPLLLFPMSLSSQRAALTLCHLKSLIVDTSTSISFTRSFSGFEANQVDFAIEDWIGTDLHDGDKSRHGRWTPEWLVIWCPPRECWPSHLSCFSSHCVFSLGNLLQTHGYQWPFNPCY